MEVLLNAQCVCTCMDWAVYKTKRAHKPISIAQEKLRHVSKIVLDLELVSNVKKEMKVARAFEGKNKMQ